MGDMRLMVLTAAVWPSETEARQKLWIFLRSAEKAEVPKEDLHLYGMGRGFPGYKAMMLDMQLDYLKQKGSGYTHVLFHDGWDGMFTGSLAEVWDKYTVMGRPPMVISAFYQLGNVSDEEKQYPGCFAHNTRYCYPNRGGYIAEVPYLIKMFERMLKLPRQTGDDCFNHYDAWQEGWYRPVLDSKCDIFQVTDGDCAMKTNGRLGNHYTNSSPCLLHLSGGYTDQVTGMDRVMVPWAKKLGVIE